MRTETAFFEDFAVDDHVVTPARTLTETDIVQFAALTGDWTPIHTDVEYAKTTPFGERIVHGLLMLAISAGLMLRAGKKGLPISIVALYQIEKARFIAPVRIADTIHVVANVVALKPIDDRRGLVTINHKVTNQKDDVVLTFTSKLIVNRRAA